MLDRTIVLWTLAACMSATPVAAQAPATVFDGKYVGTATVEAGKDPADCLTTSSMDMTIAGGLVRCRGTTGLPLPN